MIGYYKWILKDLWDLDEMKSWMRFGYAKFSAMNIGTNIHLFIYLFPLGTQFLEMKEKEEKDLWVLGDHTQRTAKR